MMPTPGSCAVVGTVVKRLANNSTLNRTITPLPRARIKQWERCDRYRIKAVGVLQSSTDAYAREAFGK